MLSNSARISLIDLPKEHHEEDRLKMEAHTKALIEFIKGTETPMTIGIQGEWGSGKTSLMNTLSHELCDREKPYHPDKPYLAVHVNTWEHSLSGSPEITIISILQAVIVAVERCGGASATRQAAVNIGRTLMIGAAKAGANKVGIDSETVGDMLATEPASVRSLRQNLQKEVIEVAGRTGKNGIIFFIDDLDRLDPTVAVRVLEILKNLFDLNKCVFVLAIDYQVVVKGLRAKFGEMTEQNEWEFRAFFDKIIQLPFSMPISSYDTSNYVSWLLEHIGYFSPAELTEENKEKLKELADNSIGNNPRALKRLGNSISIVSLLGQQRGMTTARDVNSRLIEFGLICCQIAYPRIYSLLQRKPQFTNWNDSVVLEETRGQAVSADDLERVWQNEDFDESWEQALYRICAPVEGMRRNSFRISRLLNIVRELCREGESDESLGLRLKELMQNTSVTSVGTDNSVDSRWVTKEEFLSKCREDERDYFAEVIAYCESHEDLVIIEWGTKGFSIKDSEKRPLIWLFPKEGANAKKNIQARTEKWSESERTQIRKILDDAKIQKWTWRPENLPLAEMKNIINLTCGIEPRETQ